MKEFPRANLAVAFLPMDLNYTICVDKEQAPSSFDSAQEALELDDGAFVLTLANLLTLIIRLDAEYQTPPIYLNKFGGGAYLLTQGRGGEVTDVYMGTDGDVALVQRISDSAPGRVLHERDQHRRSEDLDASRADRGGCILVYDGGGGLASHPRFQFHDNGGAGTPLF
jgi:hypothetical protein